MKYLRSALSGAMEAVGEIVDKVFSGMFYAIGATFGIFATVAFIEKLGQ